MWILQDKEFALGNFINITPIIKYVYLNTNKKVKVYFETEYVKEAYLHNSMIEVLLEKPDTKPFATSAMICRENTMPDYEYAFTKTTGLKYTEKYKPFIYEGEVKENNYAVMVIGSGSERQEYLDSKIPDEFTLIQIINKIKNKYPLYLVGSLNDYERLKNMVHLFNAVYMGDIKKGINIIAGAAMVVGNDTGLIHASGTMDKHTFVLWKNTKLPRCRNSGANTVYSFDWLNDFDNYAKSR